MRLKSQHSPVPLVRMGESDKDSRRRARIQWRAGQPHHCGLLHRSDGDLWSPMAALIWWLLRVDPVDHRGGR